MNIPKHPKPISIKIEYAVHEYSDLAEIDQQILEYSKEGWVLEERGLEAHPYNDLYSHKAYIKLTR